MQGGVEKRSSKSIKPSAIASLGPKEILKALQAEADTLQRVHSQIRLQLKKLEVEEAVLKQMIRQERRRLAGRGQPREPLSPGTQHRQEEGGVGSQE